MSSLARAARALVLGCAVATCVDAGPTAPARRVAVSLAPSFAIGADDPVIAIERLLATVQQHPSLTVVYQTVVTVAPGDTAVSMTLIIPLVAPDDRYRITISGISAAGDTVYRARVDSVNLSPQGVAGTPIEMPLEYAGPDTLVGSVSIAPRDTTVRVGDVFAMQASAVTGAGAPLPSASLNFTSRDPARLAVSATGQVTALDVVQGAWVVVATANSRKDSTRVTVVPARTLTRLDAGPDRAFTALGDSVELAVRALDQDDVEMPGIAYSFATTNVSVASVRPDGVVRAEGPGSALVVVSSGALRDTVAVTVTQLPASLTISPASLTFTSLLVQETMEALVLDANGNMIPGATVEWSSTAPGIASVTASGAVQAVSNGTASIVARAGPAADTATVTVSQQPKVVEIGADSVVMTAVGVDTTLAAIVRDSTGHSITGAVVAWSSSDPAVATVTAEGVVRSQGAGAARVVATSGAAADTITVHVRPVPAAIVATPDSSTLTALGATATLGAVVNDAQGNPIAGAVVSWTSAAPGVATVSVSGVVNAVGTGRAAIVASHGAFTDTVQVVVRQDPAFVVASPDSLLLTAIGATAVAAAVVKDANGNVIPGATPTWSSAAPAIATVAVDGTVTAKAAGTARVIAASGTLRDTVVVTVAQQPATIVIAPRGGSFTALGQLLSLSATVRDRNGFAIAAPAVTWSTVGGGAVEVTTLGVVRAAANGSAFVRAVAGAARDSVQVSVSQQVASVVTSRDTVRLANVGDTATVAAVAYDANGFVATNHTVAFATSDPAVATVSAGGLITLTGAGIATVTATAGGISAPVAVIKTPADVPVDARYAWIRVTPSLASLRVGDTLQLLAEMMDAAGNPTVITPQWATSNPGRATVSASGAVIVHDTGAVTISATSNGVGGQARLQLAPAPVLHGFNFSPRTLYGVSGSPVRFSVWLEASDAGSGVGGVQVTFTGPGGATQSCAASAPTGGTRLRGTWECVVTLPAGSPTGTWVATELQLTGTIVRTHGEASLARFGGTTLTVNP